MEGSGYEPVLAHLIGPAAVPAGVARQQEDEHEQQVRGRPVQRQRVEDEVCFQRRAVRLTAAAMPISFWNLRGQLKICEQLETASNASWCCCLLNGGVRCTGVGGVTELLLT